MGKTVVAAGPHAHEATKGMVTFMVSPLLALQEEQVIEFGIGKARKLTKKKKVTTFQTEFGLSAVAVNSSHGGCKKEVMEVKKPLYKG